jgi:RNA polymerase sigma factor (sigma-70 family)
VRANGPGAIWRAGLSLSPVNSADEPSSVPPSDSSGEPLEVVLQRLRPRMARVLGAYRIPCQDADDVLQDALFVALEKWETVRRKELWLLGTVRYKCILYWKRQKARREEAMEVPDLESLAEPQRPAQERLELLQQIEIMTGFLGDHHREALWLRYGFGFKTAEVAEEMGYCHSSMRKLLGRSLARLQRRLDRAPSPAPRPGPDSA